MCRFNRSMKISPLVLGGLLIVWSGTAFGVKYHTGLIFEDPRTIPWLHEKKVVEVKIPLPDSVDHSAHMPPVGDQSAPSCVAWATGYYYKTYQEWQEHGWDVTDSAHIFSPTFIYNQINGGKAVGTGFSDAFKLLCDNGCANLVDCPCNEADCTIWPSETAYKNAIPFRCDSAYYISCADSEGVENLKQHIANGNVAVPGICVWSNFYNISDYNNTYCVADTTGSPGWMGHAVTIVGYNDNKNTNDGPGAFRLVNSWGTSWGDSGYFWMSYEAVKHPRLSYRSAYYSTDKIGYTPTLLFRLEINHPTRGRIQLKTGAGSPTSSLWTKYFFNWQIGVMADHPFPSHNIVFDISEGVAYIDSTGTNVFLSCRDTYEDGQDGSVEYLCAQHLGWGISSISKETPKIIPDNGDTIYVNLIIPYPQVVISPDTIPINTPTTVQINVSDYKGNPLPDVESKISGCGISPSLYDTTDGSGQCQIIVNAPYGEILSVKGRKLTESETLFEENLYVTGGVDMTNPELTAEIPPFGSYDTLAPGWETIITGSSGDTGFTIYARSSGVDTSIFIDSTSGELAIVPQAVGEITTAIGKPGYNIYTKVFPVKSVLPVSGIWTAANSPYQVMSALCVQSGRTLTIEPGVVVDFQGHYGLYVYGLLEAIGTASDSIYFTTDTTGNPDRWGGIRFINASNMSKLQYCHIEFANYSGIYCENSSPTINNNTITGNSATYSGGGIYCENSSPTIINNTITDNSANSYAGGGIYCGNSSPTVTNNAIIGNSAYSVGGGIYCGNSSPTINNNTITGNSATYSGGGICYDDYSNPTITNNTIIGNSASSGGGIYCSSRSSPTINNNTITGNSASSGGGICCSSHSNPMITNNTITDNSANSGGGGIYCYLSNPVIVNTIVYFNAADTGSQIEIKNEMCDTVTISYCDIQDKDGNGVYIDGGSINWGAGNIDADPLFVDTANGNYRLQGTSPCIDAGTPDTSGLNLSHYDLDGNIRIWDGNSDGDTIVDMGAYEYGAPPSGIVETIIKRNAPYTFFLSQNYPNPVQSRTQIRYGLPKASKVTLKIYNIAGQQISTLVNQIQKPGYYSVKWDGRDSKREMIASGIYFYRLETGKFKSTKKIILLK